MGFSYKKILLNLFLCFIFLSVLSACNDNDSINASNINTDTIDSSSISSDSKNTSFKSNFAASDSESSNLSPEELRAKRLENYTFDDFINSFSIDKHSTQKALHLKLINTALNTTRNNPYKLTLKTTYHGRNRYLIDTMYYDNGNYKIVTIEPDNSDTYFATLYHIDDNSLYYYNKEMKMPKIQKWDNEIENKSPEQTYPGSLGTMLELDYSLLEPDHIEWKYLDDKKMLYLYKKLDSTIIENYIDPTTGFSMLRRESKIDEDKTIIAIEAEVIDISFDPVFESDEFDVEKFSEILEQ